MKRIILLLTAAVVMVVTVAVSAPSAFAAPPDHAGNWGYAGEDPRWSGKDGCTWGWGGRTDCKGNK